MFHGGHTENMTVLLTFWYPLSQGGIIFIFFKFQKSRSSGPTLRVTLRGTPKSRLRRTQVF